MLILQIIGKYCYFFVFLKKMLELCQLTKYKLLYEERT